MLTEYLVKTSIKNTSDCHARSEILDSIHALGVVIDHWPDGSFNFKCHNTECTDELVDELDKFDVDAVLL